MSKLMKLLASAALVVTLGSGAAWAAPIGMATAPAAPTPPINITVDSLGGLLNAIGIANDTQYGFPGRANDPAGNLAFLNDMIGNWNGALLSPFMSAPGPLALNQGSLGGATSYSGPAGYQYVVFHWGAGQAGGGGVSPGGWWSAYYLGGKSISFADVPMLVNGEKVGGFSSANYFGVMTVPDGGMTVMLLGGALVGLAALRRKFSA